MTADVNELLPNDPPQDDAMRNAAAEVEDLAPADAAAVIGTLTGEDAAELAEYLDPRTAGRILTEMEADRAAGILRLMHVPEASMVLSAMAPDDRVDVLERVDEPLRGELVKEMPAGDAAEVRRLAEYPPDSVGGIMTTQVTALPMHLSVEQGIDELRRLSQTLEQVFYVYVVDGGGRLLGVLSMRDMILARPTRKLSEVMRTTVTSIPPSMDQEAAARFMTRLGYLALPVQDEKGRLIGLVTIDDVVDVLAEEATEDVQRMFGAGAEERLESTWHFSIKRRLPWLMVNLVLAGLAAGVVAANEGTITALAVLAVYMPVVAGMGGNATAQAMAVAIRGISVGEGDRVRLFQLALREARVGFLAGLLTGALAAGISWTMHGEHGWFLGVIVAAAMTINLTLGCLWGVTVPFLMRRLGFDPAQSATIFTTTVTDMVGFLVLLTLARWWLV